MTLGTPKLLLAGLLTVLLCAGCDTNVNITKAAGGLWISPEKVDFGRVIQGTTPTQLLRVGSTTRTNVQVSITVTGPFLAPRAIEVPGASFVEVAIRFNAGEGDAQGVVSLNASTGDKFEVPLSGFGVKSRPCVPSSPCFESTFNVESGGCVERAAPQGSICTPSDLCITEGRCIEGKCIGKPRTCNDDNACTRDACDSAIGCINQQISCPGPSGPCKTATCDPSRGCGEANRPFLSVCGPVSCTKASVCGLIGDCLTTTLTEGLPCQFEVACLPAGTCRSGVCKVGNPIQWRPKWSAPVSVTPGTAGNAILDDSTGLYFSACGLPPPPPPADSGTDDSGTTDGGTDAGTAPSTDPKPDWCGLVSYTRGGFERYAIPQEADAGPPTLVHLSGRGALLLGESSAEYHALSTGEKALSAPIGRSAVSSMAMLPNGEVAIAEQDGGVLLWTLDGGLETIDDAGAGSTLAADRTGELYSLAVTGDQGRLRQLQRTDAGWQATEVTVPVWNQTISVVQRRVIAGNRSLVTFQSTKAPEVQEILLNPTATSKLDVKLLQDAGFTFPLPDAGADAGDAGPDADAGDAGPDADAGDAGPDADAGVDAGPIDAGTANWAGPYWSRGPLESFDRGVFFGMRCPAPLAACPEAQRALWSWEISILTGNETLQAQLFLPFIPVHLDDAMLVETQIGNAYAVLLHEDGDGGEGNAAMAVIADGGASMVCKLYGTPGIIQAARFESERLTVLVRTPAGKYVLEHYALPGVTAPGVGWPNSSGRFGTSSAY